MEAIKQMTWEECVEEAKKHVANIKRSRLQITLLAIQACDIKQGGKSERDGPSVSQFAKAIGISQVSLNKWINSYKYGVKKDIVPFRKPTEEHLTKAISAHTNRPVKEKGHERSGREPSLIVKEHAKKLLSSCKSSLNQFERYKESDLRKIPDGVRNEILVKINRIRVLLTNSK